MNATNERAPRAYLFPLPRNINPKAEWPPPLAMAKSGMPQPPRIPQRPKNQPPNPDLQPEGRKSMSSDKSKNKSRSPSFPSSWRATLQILLVCSAGLAIIRLGISKGATFGFPKHMRRKDLGPRCEVLITSASPINYESTFQSSIQMAEWWRFNSPRAAAMDAWVIISAYLLLFVHWRFELELGVKYPPQPNLYHSLNPLNPLPPLWFFTFQSSLLAHQMANNPNSNNEASKQTKNPKKDLGNSLYCEAGSSSNNNQGSVNFNFTSPKDQNTIEKKLSKLKIDPSKFMTQLARAKEATQKTMESSLMAFIVGEPIEFTKLRSRLRNQWRSVPEPDFINRLNFWFEIRFKNSKDKKKIWDGRPYHVMGQLLVLKEWRPDFNTAKESKSQVDLWFRLPKLSPLFLNQEALPTILEGNGLGTLIRFKSQHNRICANMDIGAIHLETIIAPDENGEINDIKIWFEDNQKGCGYCGERDHLFHQCPEGKDPASLDHESQRRNKLSASLNSEPQQAATTDEKQGSKVSNDKGKAIFSSKRAPTEFHTTGIPIQESIPNISKHVETQHIPVIYLIHPTNKEGESNATEPEVHGVFTADQSQKKIQQMDSQEKQEMGAKETGEKAEFNAVQQDDKPQDDDPSLNDDVFLEAEMDDGNNPVNEAVETHGDSHEGNNEKLDDTISEGSNNSFKIAFSLEKHLLQGNFVSDDMESSETGRKRRNTTEDDTATSVPKGPKKKRN